MFENVYQIHFKTKLNTRFEKKHILYVITFQIECSSTLKEIFY